jgi:23S rRNA C2498 (ribose-2'-O)-methylase RlmM
MKTRSKTLPQINWDYFIFCRQKTIKKDKKLKRIESSERVKYIIASNRVSLPFSVAQDKLPGVFI